MANKGGEPLNGTVPDGRPLPQRRSHDIGSSPPLCCLYGCVLWGEVVVLRLPAKRAECLHAELYRLHPRHDKALYRLPVLSRAYRFKGIADEVCNIIDRHVGNLHVVGRQFAAWLLSVEAYADGQVGHRRFHARNSAPSSGSENICTLPVSGTMTCNIPAPWQIGRASCRERV